MPHILSIDFETRGTVELRRAGVYTYATHRDTDLWLMGWAFDDAEPALWHPGEPLPPEIVDHVSAGGEIRAWNAQFERTLWREVGVRRHGFPAARDDQFHCTAAEAAAMALPRGLEQCAAVLGLPVRKDVKGYGLMMRMCRPRKFVDDLPVWWDQADKLHTLGEYCKQDVRVERAVYGRTNRLGARERAIYLHDQTINDRGIYLDRPLASAARQIADREIARQNELLSAATAGAVERVTKVAKLKEWLATQGLEVDSLAKGALADLLAGQHLSEPVRAALDARRDASKSSIAKIDAMLEVAGVDDRLRGLMLYHGASTGRWAGKLVQPHNFPRGEIAFAEVERYLPHVLDRTLERQLAAEPDAPTALTVLSASLRSMLTAAPGRELFAADFAAIEARVLAWLADDRTMLAQFREDRPLYKEMAGLIYGRPAGEIAKPSPDYTLGKNTVLGCGFGMGWRKFMATTGVDEPLARRAVDTYRGTYWAVPQLWDDLNAAAIAATLEPGTTHVVGKIRYARLGGYLWAGLPAGRAIAYALPRVQDRETPWGEMRPAVTFCGINGYTHAWERMGLYGGLLCENVVQAVARDLLADAMLRTEASGFPNVLNVHDEVVAEVEAGADFEQFLQLVKVVPPWAAGCPVDTAGWRGHRYRKD